MWCVRTMKRIDMGGMVLVHYGRQWPHAIAPCSKGMMDRLEKNENLVYWLQPAGGGYQDQVRSRARRGAACRASDALRRCPR